jgi:hypothetical protein
MFSPPPVRQVMGAKTERSAKKLAQIQEFGFDPNGCPRRKSMPKQGWAAHGYHLNRQ